MRTLSFCFLYAFLNVSGATIIKLNLKGKALANVQEWISLLFSLKVIGAFALIFLSALVLFKALSLGQFTFIVPVATGINFALTVIVGHLIFKDPLNYISFVGFTLILSGIVILSLNTKHA